MNRREHLLVCLAEECAEVSHAVSKALRFGLDDHHPDIGMSNEGHLRVEFNDLLAVAELLEEEGVISFNESGLAREIKRQKVRHFMRYACERGTLDLDPRTCRECGCTDDDCSGCIERTGVPCHWVERDLCSACAPEASS